MGAGGAGPSGMTGMTGPNCSSLYTAAAGTTGYSTDGK